MLIFSDIMLLPMDQSRIHMDNITGYYRVSSGNSDVPIGRSAFGKVFQVAIEFANWLRDQLQHRGMTPADLAREMNSPPATVYRILNEQRGVGKRVCKKIADALKIDERIVLYHAGYVSRDPSDPTQQLDPVALDILSLLENRPEADKRAALETLRALFERLERGTSGQTADRDRDAAGRKK